MQHINMKKRLLDFTVELKFDESICDFFLFFAWFLQGQRVRKSHLSAYKQE